MNKTIRFVSALALVAVAVVAPARNAFAGDVDGAQFALRRVAPESSNFYDLVLKGGEATWVYVVGNGNTDLDCTLLNADGYKVASDTDSTDSCLLEVTPRWASTYRLRVQNLGDAFNVYVVSTN